MPERRKSRRSSISTAQKPSPRSDAASRELKPSIRAQTQHVRHRVKPGFAVPRPRDGLECAAGEERAILGMMAQRHPLALAGEDDAMIADHRAAAPRGEADIADAARASQAVTATRRMVLQRDAVAFSRRFAEQERGARGCIALHAMMHL